ncbi:hypothetical protein GGF50DRAFT_114704 [Schizophyllum commune]
MASGWQRLSDDEWFKLHNALLRDKTLDRKGQWADLPPPKKTRAQTGSKTRRANEANHFRRLEKVIEGVLVAAERALKGRFAPAKRTTRFSCRPVRATHGKATGPAQHVDAMFMRKESCYSGGLVKGINAQYPWSVDDSDGAVTADMTTAGQLKLASAATDVVDNEEKTLQYAAHAIRYDVGRAFVLSFTIEGSLMRLWHHSRSHSGVSELFDIYNKPRLFVEFILLNTYAPPSTLGIDPTVRRVLDDAAHPQHQFDIYAKDGCCRTYQTVGVIDDVDSLLLYPTSKRVYKVKQVIQNADSPHERVLDATPNVLLDYWVDLGVQNESTIQRGIIHNLESSNDWPDIKDHFMDIKHDGLVRYPSSGPLTQSGVPPSPPDSIYYHFMDQVDAEDERYATAAVKEDNLKKRNGVFQHRPDGSRIPVPEMQGMKHCRTVYAQYCVDLGSISSPALYFFAMSQVVKILKYLKRAGHVHRDVSPGNFLLHHKSGTLPEHVNAELDKWTTIISDLEYARLYRDRGANEILSGTPGFIAVEVQDQRHIFTTAHYDSDWRKPPPAICQFFSFNYYHDLEGALWLALHFAFKRVPKSKLDASTPWGPADDVLRHYAARLFPRQLERTSHRTRALMHGGDLAFFGEALVAIHGPEAPILKIFPLITALGQAYVRVEGSTDVPMIQLDNGHQVLDDSLFTDEIYDTMEATFWEISNAYLQQDEEFVRVPPPPPFEYGNDRMASPPQFADEGLAEAEEPEKITPAEDEKEEVLSRPPTPIAAPATRPCSKGAENGASAAAVQDDSFETREKTRKRTREEAVVSSMPPRKRLCPGTTCQPTRWSRRLAAKAKKA